MWSADFWNGLGVVGVVLIVGFLFLLSLQRGWLVLGIHHREVVDGLKRENNAYVQRAAQDAEAIAEFGKADAKRAFNEDGVAKILAALRETITTGGVQ